jgi:NAD-dependent SIR2 family protein deacetylase
LPLALLKWVGSAFAPFHQPAIMKPELNPQKIVILSGSGISAESGIPTFRDANGLWHSYSWQEVASPQGWQKHPEVVLEMEKLPFGFTFMPGKATEMVPRLTKRWMEEAGA